MHVIFESLFTHTADDDFVVRENEGALRTEQTPCSQICDQEICENLSIGLACLPNRERDVVVRHLGFAGECESFAQIGKSYNVSKQRVSQWFGNALKSMRQNYRKVKYEG